MYHGFILESNTHDCNTYTATIEVDDFMEQDDVVVLQEKLRQNQFYSYGSSFCLTNDFNDEKTRGEVSKRSE